MPLLKKKSFVKRGIPDFLRDDEEVFYCEITNEIFREYDEFSERMLLCNSMVWTCSMTGKQNLTYSEALESEENAKKSLKEFPLELRIPILYLASKTLRTSFGDMADDVFTFVKDRYFVGENLEASFTSNKWKDCHVLQVIAPSEAQIKNAPKNGSDRNFGPAPNLFKYEIEHLDADDQDISEIMIVDCNQLRRKKSLFSKEKSKLFLKQYVEQSDNGMFAIKQSVLEEFGINKIKFDQIFDGPLPLFETSKRKEKATVNGKKATKQESMAKYLTKNGTNGVKHDKEKDDNLLERMRLREEEFKLKKKQKEEEKLAKRKQKKQENIKIANYLKEWRKPKEDLELEDQKELPQPTPVKSKLPDKYIGDMLMVLEFVNSFSKFLAPKNFFPNGFTLEVLERALAEDEVAGPLTDLIQMFLTALFNVQDEESAQYRTQVEANKKELKEEDLQNNLSLYEATRLATKASSWSNQYQGFPLGRLPLYSLTVSEILRLHLLSSGARINDTGAKWRYAQRGGYNSEDDPGLYLRLHQSHILKSLATHNVVELSISDKLKVISCLINQLLTYADVRDEIEERLDKTRQCKNDLKLAQTSEKKREQEYTTAKYKIKKEMKEDPAAKAAVLEKLKVEFERKKQESERNIGKLLKAVGKTQVVMGHDRAFRKYLKLESVPGIFVNSEEDNPGTCLDEIVHQIPELQNVSREQMFEIARKSFEEIEPKLQKKLNGTNDEPMLVEQIRKLLLCTADPRTCIVHSAMTELPQWSFFHEEIELDQLIDSLNSRGYRESELQQVLKNDKDCLVKLLAATPANQLNPKLDLEEKEREQRALRARKSQKDRYEDANLGYPTDMSPEEVLHQACVDNILEMEEKIFAGNLGCLSVKNRDEWRNCLANKNYPYLDPTIIRRDYRSSLKVKSEAKRSRSNSPEIPEVKPEIKEYQDPGRFLGATEELDEDAALEQSEETAKAIQSLSLALLQVALAVEPRYLKKPLGHGDVWKNEKKKDFDVLEMWEQSLLASTSFSQVFLHYGTLDSCVMWSRSALLARCRICRRQKDSENMLLCDSCNMGHHLYCLKPKLTSVPQGEWFCDKCRKEKEPLEIPEPTPRKKRRIFRVEEEDSENESDVVNDLDHEQMDVDEDIHQSGNAEAKSDLCKTCGSTGEFVTCEKCADNYHVECVQPPMRRIPRGSWLCKSCKEKDKESDDEVFHSRRNRRDDRDDLPLHNAALQELLSDVMKHPDSWAFIRPVQKNEVPDYYDVITRPMDFGTIKYKLNMGEYNEDWQLMRDAILVFENCNTYNHTEADVYKCGVRLLKHFRKKCKELALKVPEELMDDETDDELGQSKGKKRRLK